MTDPTTPDARRRGAGQLALGALAVLFGAPVGLGVLAAVVSFGDVETAAYVFLFGALAIGVVQGLWVLPLALWAWTTGRTAFLQGALIAAAVVFSLNAGCYGLMITLGTLTSLLS